MLIQTAQRRTRTGSRASLILSRPWPERAGYGRRRDAAFQLSAPSRRARCFVQSGGFLSNSQPSSRFRPLVSFGRRLLAPPHGAAVRVQPAHDRHGSRTRTARPCPRSANPRPDHPTPPPPRTHATRLRTATTYDVRRPSGSIQPS